MGGRLAHYSPIVRIVSLVPHATELLFALGAGDEVVGVTHECDFPPQAAEREQVTRDMLPAGLSAAEIDAAVRERTQHGEAIYALDVQALGALEPDLIVTQALCPVCAVCIDDVRAVSETLPSRPRVLALDPRTVEDTLADVITVADATGRHDRGTALVARSHARIDRVRRAVHAQPRRPVVALEWLDPVYLAGHWTPQMIELAGGREATGRTRAGEPSQRSTWETVALARPEVVVVMPCGFDAPGALGEAEAHVRELSMLGAQSTVAVDASAYFSRPGPRLIDGLELLAHVLHPARVPKAPAEALILAAPSSAAALG